MAELWACPDCGAQFITTDAYHEHMDREHRPNGGLSGVPRSPHMPAAEHLGDGVYVSFDGFQLWLAVNHHENKVVALEPGVLERLNGYAARINEARGVNLYKVPEVAG